MLKKRYLFLIMFVCLFAISAVSAEQIANDTNIMTNDYDSSLTAESVDKNLLTDSYGTFLELQDEIDDVEKSGSVNLTAHDLTKYYGGSEKFVVTLTDNDDNPLVGQVVGITINDRTYTRTTDFNGAAYMDIGLSTGDYDVVVSYEDITVNSKVTVLSTINGNDVEIYGDNGEYYATFLDSSGNYLAKNTVVTFNLNNIFYNRVIMDNKGTAKLDVNEKPGKYIISALNPVTGKCLLIILLFFLISMMMIMVIRIITYMCLMLLNIIRILKGYMLL